jgi:cbb3-type cytochrome oxidase maturation protein
VTGSFAAQATELMSVIFLLITASTIVAAVFLAAFIRAVIRGQFDDVNSPAVRILHEPQGPKTPTPPVSISTPTTDTNHHPIVP